MKKALSLILALVMAFSLVACGGGKSDNPATPDSPTNGDVAEAKSLRVVQETLLGNADPSLNPGVAPQIFYWQVYEGLVAYDEKTGEWYIDDQYTFSCDSQQGLDTQPELRWQMIASDFQAGMYGDPTTTAAKLAAWLAREKAGYPEAHVQVEYFRALLRAEREAAQQQQAAAQMQNNMIEGANV